MGDQGTGDQSAVLRKLAGRLDDLRTGEVPTFLRPGDPGYGAGPGMPVIDPEAYKAETGRDWVPTEAVLAAPPVVEPPAAQAPPPAAPAEAPSRPPAPKQGGRPAAKQGGRPGPRSAPLPPPPTAGRPAPPTKAARQAGAQPQKVGFWARVAAWFKRS